MLPEHEYCNEKGITGFANKHGLAKEVSYLYIDIPTDEELFIREVPDKGKKHYLMEIHRLFRRIEVEQERLAEVSPYCVPGSDYCCSVEPCGVPEHYDYQALLEELYNHQRSLAITGECTPYWATESNVWLRGHENF